MPTFVPREPTIAALGHEFAAVQQLLVGLTAEQWAAPSPLPGWDVKANLVHLLGTETMLAGDASPEVSEALRARAHVRNDIGAFNEAWIDTLAATPGEEVLARFAEVAARRLGQLEAMGQDEWDAVSFTPAGQDTYGRFMRIRAFDCWMHEQDARDALGRPGHLDGPVVDLALDEMQGSMGFVVGKRAGAPDGSSVTFRLTGATGRQIHVAVDGRAAVVDALSGEPTVTLTMPVGVFTRLGGGRVNAAAVAERVEIGGDESLGHTILANMAYTI